MIEITNLSDMVGKIQIPQSVCERMSYYWQHFPDLNEKQYSDLVYQTEISTDEFLVIQALKTSIAIDMVEGKINAQNFMYLKEDHRWIETYRKNNFKGSEDAEVHLRAVDEFYLKKYHAHYELWWIDAKNEVALLDWDTVMSDRVIKKYGEKGQKKQYSNVLGGDF